MGLKGTIAAQALTGLSSILGAARRALSEMEADGQSADLIAKIDAARHDLQAAANGLTVDAAGAAERARAALEAAKELQAELEAEAAG